MIRGRQQEKVNQKDGCGVGGGGGGGLKHTWGGRARSSGKLKGEERRNTATYAQLQDDDGDGDKCKLCNEMETPAHIVV